MQDGGPRSHRIRWRALEMPARTGLRFVRSEMPDGSAVETLHGTPEMVAAWAYPPVSDPVAAEEGLTDDRLAAEVASLAGAVHRGAR